MAYIIANNLFTKDSRGVRGTRLSFISGNIDSYAAELEIEAALLAWGRSASAAFDAALFNQTNKIGEKGSAFQVSQDADAALLERYIQLRKLLKSRYGGDKLTLKEFGIAGQIPKNNQHRYYKAIELMEKNAERLAAGDARALPAVMAASLAPLADDVDIAYKTAMEAGRVGKQSTDNLNRIFDADSVQLRILYNWCVSYWGKHDPRLINLGFVQAKVHHRGQPAAPQNLSYDSLASVFSWDAVGRATSYQCEMQNADSSGAEWNEIYEGAETSFIWQKVAGRWNAKVRARNQHGFGKWGDILKVTS